MGLETEIKTYKRSLPDLVDGGNEGKFVTIHGDQVLGVYDTYEDALKVGYDKCTLEPFLVKRIAAVEQVQYFSRDLETCHT